MIEAFIASSGSWTSSRFRPCLRCSAPVWAGAARWRSSATWSLPEKEPSSANRRYRWECSPHCGSHHAADSGAKGGYGSHPLRSHYNRSRSPSDRNDQQGGERSGTGKRDGGFSQTVPGSQCGSVAANEEAIAAGLHDDLESSLRPIEEIYLNKLMKSHDAQEGLKAFLEKRKPVWKDE